MRPALILGLSLALAGPAAAQNAPNAQNNIQPVAPMGPGGPAPSQNIQPVAPMGPLGPAPQQAAPAQGGPQGGPQGGAPNVEQWGDDQNGGFRSFQSGPDGQGGHVQEEVVRQWSSGGGQWSQQQQWAPPQQWGPGPCCGSVGGFPVPTYGYAAQNYGWPGQGCCMAGRGEVSFSSSSSSFTSGVGGYLADGVWPGGYWGGAWWPGGSWPDGRFVGSRRWDYDSGWRNLPGGGPPMVAPR